MHFVHCLLALNWTIRTSDKTYSIGQISKHLDLILGVDTSWHVVPGPRFTYLPSLCVSELKLNRQKTKIDSILF